MVSRKSPVGGNQKKYLVPVFTPISNQLGFVVLEVKEDIQPILSSSQIFLIIEYCSLVLVLVLVLRHVEQF